MSNTESTKWIPAIEAFRFLSIIQICIWHFSVPCIDAGFLGVEFFFVLTGFFMYRDATKRHALGITDYSIKKMSKFLCKYILAVWGGYLIFMPSVIQDFYSDWLHTLLHLIGQILMIQGFGIFSDSSSINPPLWFFSVMIWGGAIVYGLIRYYTRLSLICLFPIACILFFSFVSFGPNERFETWEVIGGFPIPLVRGICEMAYGVIIGCIVLNYASEIEKKVRMLNLISIIAIVLYIAIVISNRQDAIYSMIFIPCIISSCYIRSSFIAKLFSSKVWLYLGRLSYDIFVIHYLLIALIRHFIHVEMGVNIFYSAILFYVILIPCAVLFDKGAKSIDSLITGR